jgi:hypothetical protein
MRPKTPRGLGRAGQKLWRWLTTCYTIDGAEPLAMELATLTDRLEEIRQALKAPDLTAADRGRLVNAEVKVNAAYTRTWRVLGLSDDPRPDRGPGRPCASDKFGG